MANLLYLSQRRPASRLPIELDVTGDVFVARPEGELDGANAELLDTVIERGRGRCQRVTLDLSDVSFVDSSGLRAMLICESKLSAEGVAFVVVNANEQAHRLFELTGTTHLLGDVPGV